MSRRQVLKLTAVTGAALAFGGGLTRELLRRAGLRRVGRTRTQMGTRMTVTVVHPDAEAARGMVERTFAEVERLEGILSRYRPDSPVSRLARSGVVDAPPELTEVLGPALALSRRTEGAFDVTVAPLLELYRSRSEAGRRLPTAAEVEERLALVDYRRVHLEGGAVRLERPGMALTLDGIAKGYVLDRAVATLVAAGAERVMVEAGGDLATAGDDLPAAGRLLAEVATEDEGWRVAIRDPHDLTSSLGALRLRGQGVASSGDYVHAFTQDRLHHHIVDPRSGRSPEHTSGVTVLAPSAMEADALSTAAFVLGPGEGIELLESLEGVEGLVVAKDGSRTATRGLRHASARGAAG